MFGTIRSGSRLERPSSGSPMQEMYTCRSLTFICPGWENHIWFLRRFCPRLLLASSTCRGTQVLKKENCIFPRWSCFPATVITKRTSVPPVLVSTPSCSAVIIWKIGAIRWIYTFLLSTAIQSYKSDSRSMLLHGQRSLMRQELCSLEF